MTGVLGVVDVDLFIGARERQGRTIRKDDAFAERPARSRRDGSAGRDAIEGGRVGRAWPQRRHARFIVSNTDICELRDAIEPVCGAVAGQRPMTAGTACPGINFGNVPIGRRLHDNAVVRRGIRACVDQ
ncbi:hypothetical protein [Mesorhizobium sp.]|uniref:hypothetical protein n=1 Tax=Mesorhizobium sp. TaxID=1871066 RepID=UPI000FE66478|nr:hypothetical protein [Mesorhizobium sp.]RWE94462.1 MAG: hypothetical protein EOS68_21420 [Mesorhizobium sp.]